MIQKKHNLEIQAQTELILKNIIQSITEDELNDCIIVEDKYMSTN
jgi:hypothetical protein